MNFNFRRSENDRRVRIAMTLVGLLITFAGCGGGLNSQAPVKTIAPTLPTSPPTRTSNPGGTFAAGSNICDFLFAPYEFMNLDPHVGIAAVGISGWAGTDLAVAKAHAEEDAISSLNRQFLAETEMLITSATKIAKDYGKDEIFGEATKTAVFERYAPRGYIHGTRFVRFCVYPDIQNAETIYAYAFLDLDTTSFTKTVLEIMKSQVEVQELRNALDRSYGSLIETLHERREEYEAGRMANPLGGD